MPAPLLLGTIGWTNEDWTGIFYPPHVVATRRLEAYARFFPTVEIDATFYGTPRISTITNWAAQVPSNFRFSAKVPKSVTHDRRLIDAAESAIDFADTMQEHLGDKLATLLIQLPPDFGMEEYGRLRLFLERVAGPRRPRGSFRWAVEFRNRTMADTDVLAVLDYLNVICVTTDRLDMGTPLRYVRLLGTEHAFSRFNERQVDRTPELTTWSDHLKAEALETDTPIYVYTRDYFEGYSPGTLEVLSELLEQKIEIPTGPPQMSLFD